ncbi:MAG: hypothetical protein PHE18_01570 [Candidatus Omnitrophica bacterium]|nr:hypothetical protein [Candidatus Omnitrophota bacterium]MDD5552543.1 hypothetical protein [Candidatus Omnitrophota bacterium]
MLFNRKGQNTAEYAILIALVVAVAVAMQTYVKRSMQGGVKYTVDKLKKGETGTGQYEPYYLQSQYQTTQGAFQDIEETKLGGGVERTYAGQGGSGEKKTTRAGYQKTTAYEEPQQGGE